MEFPLLVGLGFKPTNPSSPKPGEACFGDDGDHFGIAGTQCDKLTDPDGDKVERCCPARQVLNCDAESGKWVEVRVEVDKTSAACTYRALPSGSGAPNPAQVLGF